MHRGHWLHQLPSFGTLNGYIRLPELVVEFLDLLLDSLQTGAHFHSHILVMNHQYPGDFCLDPRSLKLVLLHLR
jgi:hypothetical protein